MESVLSWSEIRRWEPQIEKEKTFYVHILLQVKYKLLVYGIGISLREIQLKYFSVIIEHQI